MIMNGTVIFILLVVLTVEIVQGNGAGLFFYEHPMTAIVAPNDMVVFSCAGSEFTSMWFGDFKIPTNDPEIKRRVNIIDQGRSSDDHNVTLILNASVENNNVKIECVTKYNYAGSPTNRSMTAYLNIAGPPLAPIIVKQKLLNATSLRIAWTRPFTWLPYPIQNYSITASQGSSVTGGREIVTVDNQTLMYVYVRENITLLCNELTLVVTASNTLGKSDNSTSILPCYGPPLTPAIVEHKLLEATSLLITWAPPFTWLPYYPLQSYSITAQRSSVSAGGSETIIVDSQTLMYVYVRKNITLLCNELTLVVTASNALGESDSSTSILPCYGPPLAPAITEHKLLNATSLLIAWSPPFTWLPIQSYKITVEGDFVHERKEILTMEPTGSNQTQVFVYTKKDIVCGEVITFTVTAINSVAESDNSAPVVSGFPIDPEVFLSPIKISVDFDQYLSPSVEIAFNLTKACSYQQVFYTLNCTNTVTGSVIQKGSRSHTEPNNNIVKITLDDVDQDQLYRCVVLIEVGSGSTVSKTTTFNAKHSPVSKQSQVSTLLISMPSALGSCALLLGISVLAVFIFLHHRKSHGGNVSSREPKQLPIMVTNPIYSDGAIEPLYEAIDETNIKICVSHQSFTDSRYQDMPPTLPLMRKEKEMIKAMEEKESETILKEAYGKESLPPITQKSAI